MIFERFYNDELAQASFLIGCAASGEAIVVDPNRWIEQYVEAARARGLRIVAVTETHIHADYLSGSRELARLTGARLYLSDEGDAGWKYAFASEDAATLLRDGDHVMVGGVRLDVMATPGHTPEHVSFLVTNTAASSQPAALLSGDFVFVGDVGRPDLLETAAGIAGTMEPAARTLYASIQRLLELPDGLVIWPGHGAGSACGKSLGGSPATSLGYERVSNWALRARSEVRFLSEVLSNQPDVPKYFAKMKRLNKEGPPMRPVRALARADRALIDRVAVEGLVLDIRPSERAAAGHPRGVLHIPADRSFVTWAGWLVPYDAPILLLAESELDAASAARSLTLIGLDEVAGWIPEASLDRLDEHGWGRLAPEEALSRDDLLLVDVRSKAEWSAGHVPGAVHIPLGDLPERVSELPSGGAIAVHCQRGSRSPIAASLLQHLGFPEVYEVPDGYEGLEPLCRPHHGRGQPAR